MVSVASTETTLQHRVDRAITSSPYLAGRKLHFETEPGRIVLRGVVNSFFQKQMAQEALRRVEGVGEIANELEVMWS